MYRKEGEQTWNQLFEKNGDSIQCRIAAHTTSLGKGDIPMLFGAKGPAFSRFFRKMDGKTAFTKAVFALQELYKSFKYY